MKFKRQAAIVDLIGKQEIKTQEELSEKLRKTAPKLAVFCIFESKKLEFVQFAQRFELLVVGATSRI